MRCIGFLYPPFLTASWTTVGKTIYYPNTITFPLKPRYYSTIKHHIVHVKQYEEYGIFLFLLLYFFVPLPLFFSYFRWKFKREAYSQVDIKNEKDIDNVVENLAKHCMYPWPKSWMRKWFLKELERLNYGEYSK